MAHTHRPRPGQGLPISHPLQVQSARNPSTPRPQAPRYGSAIPPPVEPGLPESRGPSFATDPSTPSASVSRYTTRRSKKLQPQGPRDAIYSYGWMIASELSKRLEAEGSEVRFLASLNQPRAGGGSLSERRVPDGAYSGGSGPHG
ncbi:uncharacterized protein BP01DRAFT_364041 [Aspergillus saccharolyticus JOP 1030-1]|uniref:Uncharacterized protein n=1 Tax=Aspergillus saccharolyticus JOP 1030-1 TaxID=1450539 RepID=A0A319A6M7_9EURO|nr:hypothetical protein BP01DRAFT_364041 [Aspergillus saccharolyticus JOP 1030-1]PYH47648.1 hypothetical protein BP01DRAFT_364041 [Aspergillus saccharolyticus JOP 1030-1]